MFQKTVWLRGIQSDFLAICRGQLCQIAQVSRQGQHWTWLYYISYSFGGEYGDTYGEDTKKEVGFENYHAR